MKILLVDDHKLIKMGIKILLEDYPNYRNIDECSSKSECFEKLEKDKYDLILCDISLPDGTGYDILKNILANNIQTKVIILSMHEDKSYVKKSLKLGARGYVTKSNAHEEILTAIDVVINKGEVYLSSKYRSVFYEMYKESSNLVELSKREKEVAKYIIEGYTLTEIGEKLFLSVKTVDTYKKRIMDKTNTKRRSELVEYFKEHLIL